MPSVLDTFYLLFKSNSSDVVKGNKEIEKTAVAAGEATKKTNEESTKLGKAFTNAVEDATRALAAYVSYQGIKSGIIDAQEFNRSLSIQSRLWNQNSNEVAGYGAAIKSAGGSVQELVGWYDQIYKQNAAIGAPTKPIGKLLDQIHNQVKGLTPEAAQFIFDKYGISGVGTRALLSQSDEEYNKSISKGLLLANQTAKASAAAEQFGKSWDNLTTSLTKFWSTVGEFVLPVLSKFIDVLSDLFNYLGENKAAAAAFFTVLVAGSIAFTAAIPSIISGFSSIAAAALAASIPISKFLGILGAIAFLGYQDFKGAQAIIDPSQRESSMLGRGTRSIAEWIDPDVKGLNGSTGGGNGGGGSLAFWKSQGYSDAAAAGLAANELRESSGNPAARGDGGKGVGLFQWHPDRAANILKNTGIDVRSANREDQLKAAAWELQNMGLSEALKGMTDPAAAAAFVSGRYERPANGLAEARIRASSALQIAGSTPYGSQGSGASGASVHIDTLNVHSQATDAAGIAGDISQELKNQIRQTFAQSNDAVAY